MDNEVLDELRPRHAALIASAHGQVAWIFRPRGGASGPGIADNLRSRAKLAAEEPRGRSVGGPVSRCAGCSARSTTDLIAAASLSRRRISATVLESRVDLS